MRNYIAASADTVAICALILGLEFCDRTDSIVPIEWQSYILKNQRKDAFVQTLIFRIEAFRAIYLINV